MVPGGIVSNGPGLLNEPLDGIVGLGLGALHKMVDGLLDPFCSLACGGRVIGVCLLVELGQTGTQFLKTFMDGIAFLRVVRFLGIIGSYGVLKKKARETRTYPDVVICLLRR
jgi:hypothetical protein